MFARLEGYDFILIEWPIGLALDSQTNQTKAIQFFTNFFSPAIFRNVDLISDIH
jgi:hypothetical protein